MDKNIEDLQKKLEQFGMLSEPKIEHKEENIPLEKKYIFADDKNAIIVSSSKKEFFRITNEGEFIVNGEKIDVDKEFIQSFTIVLEELLGESHGEMMKRVRREARQDVIKDLERLYEDIDEILIKELIEKWK